MLVNSLFAPVGFRGVEEKRGDLGGNCWVCEGNLWDFMGSWQNCEIIDIFSIRIDEKLARFWEVKCRKLYILVKKCRNFI